MSTPEQEIKNSILSWLRMKQIFCWPVDSVGIFDPVKKIYRKKNSPHHMKGVSDIIGIYKGKPLAIEVKSPVGRLTPEQKCFLETFKNLGGYAILARSVQDVEEGLK